MTSFRDQSEQLILPSVPLGKRTSASIARSTPSEANFLLCQVGRDGPDLPTLLARCRARDLYLRDVGSMGETVGDLWFRIAVKDRATNRRMIDILRRSVRG